MVQFKPKVKAFVLSSLDFVFFKILGEKCIIEIQLN